MSRKNDYPIPEDGDQCPECRHGQLEVQDFGAGAGKEVYAWCVGLNGVRQEDADEEEEEQAGCGWSEVYTPNKK